MSPPRVCILSTRRETLDRLHAYLRQAGILSVCRRSIVDLGTVTRDGATAVVIFPDEFHGNAIANLLRELRTFLPDALLLLVTGSPQHFQAMAHSHLAVFPKPSFGWDILDAVRAHAERAGG